MKYTAEFYGECVYVCLYVVLKQYVLCTTWQVTTVSYSIPPLSLPALLDLCMCHSKCSIHSLIESEDTVMHSSLGTEDISGELPSDLQQQQRYSLPSPLGMDRYPGSSPVG